MMKDYALIATAYNNMVRIYVGTTTNLVEEARNIHNTWPTATAAFGRTLTVSALMGLMYKDEEQITIRIKGDGPIGNIFVEANPNGTVRGEIQNGQVYLKKGEKLDVGKAVGNGFLYVTKDLKLKDYYTSSSELQTSEIAEDFTYYFAVSEQTPSSVGLGVLVDIDSSVKSSGGYILQLMPNTTEEVIVQVENVIKNLKPISTLIAENKTPEDILNILASNTEKILKKQPLKYYCPCSKESFGKALQKLDKNTLNEIITEDGQAEIICHFCHKKYIFSKDELKQLIK